MIKVNDTDRPFLILVFATIFLALFGVISHNAYADTVTTTIPVSGAFGVVTNPNTNLTYVATGQGYQIQVINDTNNAVIATIQTHDPAPTQNNSGSCKTLYLAVNPITNLVYADNGGCELYYQNVQSPYDASVSVINGTNKVVAIIPLGNNWGSFPITVNPVTNKIYTSDFEDDVDVIDGKSNTVTTLTLKATEYDDIASNPNSNMVYVLGQYGATSVINVINGSTNSIVNTFAFGGYSQMGIGVNPATNKVYVSNAYPCNNTGNQFIGGNACNANSGPFVSVIDGTTDQVLSTIPDTDHGYVGINPITDKIYIGNNGGNTVSIIDGQTNAVTSQVQVGNGPFGIGINANTNKIYVSNSGSSTVSVIDGSSSSSTSTAPSAPQNLSAVTTSSSQINLKWTAPVSNGGSPITGYKIERSTGNGTTWSTVQSNTGSTATTYNDTGLSPSTTYTYRVSAINSVGTSSPSNTASATTSATAPPPTGITLNNIQSTSGTVSASPYQITLANFNAGTGSNQLLVVGVTANNNNVASVTFGGAQLTKKVSSFSNNDAEFWYLKNPTGTGNIVVTMAGSTSAVVGAYSFSGVNQSSPLPTSTTNHNSAAGSPTVTITTTNPNDWVLDLPSIYGGVTLGSPTCTQQWNTHMPSAITGASSSKVIPTPGSVTCKWTASSGDMWDDVAVEIKASGTSSGGTTTVPSSPTGLAATAGNAQVSLSWSTPSSNGGSAITGYDIYRGTAPGGESSTPIATGATSTAYTDSGLTNGQAYYYKVTAVNSVGQSPQSNESNATPTAPPPAGVTVQSIDQNNKPIFGIDTLLCRQGTSNYANGTTTCATGESRISSGLTTVTFTETAGQTFGVEVEDSKNCTFNHWTDNGNNRFRLFTAQSPPPTLTAAFSCVAANSTAPSAPQNLQATGGNAKVSLSWTAPSSNGGSPITGYSVYRGTASGGESTTPIVTGIASTSYSDTSVTNGTTYYYDIKAVNSVGTSSPSNEASAMPTAPPPPTGIVLNNVQSTSGTTTSNQITLSGFNAGSGSNQLLVVGVSANNAAVTSVTFGGTQLTQKISSFSNNDAEFWYLKNPSGSGNIVVTMGGSTSAVVGAYSFSGVDQTTPIPTSVTNHNTSSSSPTISITTQYPNSWVLDLPSIYGGVTLGSPTCIQQWDTNISGAITGASSSAVKTSAGSATCSWTASNGGDLWDDAAIEIAASK